MRCDIPVDVNISKLTLIKISNHAFHLSERLYGRLPAHVAAESAQSPEPPGLSVEEEAGVMEIPVHDVVNTGEETFRVGNGQTGFINVCLTRWLVDCLPWCYNIA